MCLFTRSLVFYSLFFFTDTPPTEIYTLSLHDALPISVRPDRTLLRSGARLPHPPHRHDPQDPKPRQRAHRPGFSRQDRKSTRLNSSHPSISYAVFCLKKKKKKKTTKQ